MDSKNRPILTCSWQVLLCEGFTETQRLRTQPLLSERMQEGSATVFAILEPVNQPVTLAASQTLGRIRQIELTGPSPTLGALIPITHAAEMGPACQKVNHR